MLAHTLGRTTVAKRRQFFKRLLWLSALALYACGGGGSAESSKPVQADSAPVDAPAPYQLPDDLDIAGLVYDPFYSSPDGFFVDERATTSSSYTIHHVMDEAGNYEVCTDDFATAEAWEAADNDSRAVKGYYVGARETERYFEFIRELAYNESVGNVTSPTSPGYARIFKCSNTSRDGVDRSSRSGFAGILNSAPRNAEDVRIFAEYLWQFAFFPYRHKKVIDSIGAGSAATLDRTLVLAFAINQGSGRCDRIEVVNWAFRADRATGRVDQSFEIVHAFEARLEDGSPLVCSSGPSS